jgi:hypothetical protein
MELPQDSAFGFMPQNNAEAMAARERGWWVAEFNHMPNGMVRVRFAFPERQAQVLYIQPAYWNARAVENLGRSYAGLGVQA